MTRYALAALLLVACGCGGSPTAPSKTVALGAAFALRVGESVLVSDELLELTFDGVSSDSRCPIGVFCIQAGEAVLRVTVRRLPETTAALVLHSEPRHSSASFQGFVVTLSELTPYPRIDEPIAPGDYVATLAVTRP